MVRILTLFTVRCTLLLTVLAIGNNRARCAVSCADVFKGLSDRVSSETPFTRDFGNGLYLEKLANQEFVGGHPPTVFNSVRSAQEFLLREAALNTAKPFTLMLKNVTESEAFAFRAMLERDSLVKASKRLTAILFNEDVGANTNFDPSIDRYALGRARALAIRESLLKRYDWRSATVKQVSFEETGLVQSYRLTIPLQSENPTFLLKLYLKAKEFANSKAEAIYRFLERDENAKATPEQLARKLVDELKSNDPGISDGSLAVEAADFIIAKIEFDEIAPITIRGS